MLDFFHGCFGDPPPRLTYVTLDETTKLSTQRKRQQARIQKGRVSWAVALFSHETTILPFEHISASWLPLSPSRPQMDDDDDDDDSFGLMV